MSNGNSDWNIWSKYVLNALEEINKKIDQSNDNYVRLTEHVNHRNDLMTRRIKDLEEEKTDMKKDIEWMSTIIKWVMPSMLALITLIIYLVRVISLNGYK
jgi:hypothetical protein